MTEAYKKIYNEMCIANALAAPGGKNADFYKGKVIALEHVLESFPKHNKKYTV